MPSSLTNNSQRQRPLNGSITPRLGLPKNSSSTQHITILPLTMQINQTTAIRTTNAFLIPYEAHHVPTYHTWMQDPAIQEATASEPLTLAEEYSNQQSWRTARDKLTFIICDIGSTPRGDVNFFVHRPSDDGTLLGEIDVMIAEKAHRGRGLGRAAVEALLVYVCRNLGDVLAEYARDEGGMRMSCVVAKIREDNAGSRALFAKLGFRERGEVNYFGEVEMVMLWKDVERLVDGLDIGYREVEMGSSEESP